MLYYFTNSQEDTFFFLVLFFFGTHQSLTVPDMVYLLGASYSIRLLCEVRNLIRKKKKRTRSYLFLLSANLSSHFAFAHSELIWLSTVATLVVVLLNCTIPRKVSQVQTVIH